MSRQANIYGFVTSAAICLLFLIAGCVQTSTLALKFAPQDSTTYKVTTQSEMSLKFEGPTLNKNKFKDSRNQTTIEMTFTQQVLNTDDKGNAVIEVKIKELKYLSIYKDKTTLGFDSTREKDRNEPLGKLVGQSYTIEMTPSGRVSKVIDANDARAAVSGNRAPALLSADVIKERHTVTALPTNHKEKLRIADNWSSIKILPFPIIGSRAYERIYTLKQIKTTLGRKYAIIEMNAIPSAEMAKQLHTDSTLFKNTETYTGELKLDLTNGKVEKFCEELRSEWDPSALITDDEETNSLKMGAIRSYCIEKID